MMLVMPTPGGSGFAEAVFSEYMAEFIPVGFVVVMALMWRIVTYYPYLFIGAIVVPRWVKKYFQNKVLRLLKIQLKIIFKELYRFIIKALKIQY